MANDGSTKPTYSELEAELLRVRGLLQRLVAWSEKYPKSYVMNMGGLRKCEEELDALILEAKTGAESADIGKLDSADESGVESKSVHLFGHDVPLPPGIEKLVADSIDAMTEEQLAKFRKDSAAIMEKSRGSAETGGEKADHD